MSLREQAAADLQAILEDSTEGFGWPIQLTSPAGSAFDLTGLSTDIGLTIDPQTGQAVSGRRASIALSLRRLEVLGIGVPRAVADSASKPWLVTFADIGGASHTFKVSEVLPDRAVGSVVCFLEAYRPSSTP